MEENFHMVRQFVAITSSSCMGLAGFCGLLWRLTGTVGFSSRQMWEENVVTNLN